MTAEPDTEEEVALRGVLQREIYASPDGLFQVAQMEPQPPADAVVVAGDFRGCAVGDTVEIRGRRVVHQRYGPQLRIASIQWVPPVTPEGLRRFLAGGGIPGIGDTLAARIVELFGTSTLEVLDEHPERLTEVSGIGTAKARAIAAAWRSKRAGAEEAAFLASLGLGTALSRRIQRTLGPEAALRIREDPFLLARTVEGVGFRTADDVARHLDVPPESPLRLRAALEYVLSESADSGHVFAARSALVRRTASLLALPRGPVEDCLDQLLACQVLLAEALPQDQAVYLPVLHAAEREVAAELRRRAADRSLPPEWDPGAALQWIEPRLSFTLTDNQRTAARLVFSHSLCILTGGPGVGKTTLVRVVAEVLEKQGQELALAAPTGRAARRLEEACGRPAMTLHRLLRFHPVKRVFEHDRDHPLPVDALLVDEASMVDLLLLRDVLRALPHGARLILVGDADQLPSVGPGEVLRSLVQSGTIPTARLTRILRQREGSSIVSAAHHVLAGEVPEFQKEAGEGAFWIKKEHAEDLQRTVVELVSERLPRTYGWKPRRDIQVLTPMRRGPLGVIELNRLLKEALNPTGDRVLGPGDRVMQTRNNYDLEVSNGEIGIVSSFDAGAPVVAFEDRTVTYTPEAAPELTLAYATTVHKSQGCEFPAVVLVLAMQHFLLLRRNLLYTAVTRARNVLVVVAEERALHQAIAAGDVERRNSFLEELLRRPDVPEDLPPMNPAPRLEILHEDADLVFVNKPAGLTSVPSPGVSGKTCLSELKVSHPEARAVHRLDRETSGVMCFARSESAAHALIEEFRARRVEKKYWAWVRGTPAPRSGEIRRPIEDRGKHAEISRHGQNAITRYRVLDRYREVCRVEAVPVTGRYNQIRLHFAALGHPLVGERKYARGKESPLRFRRVALHAHSLALRHPRTGQPLTVTAPLPADLEQLAASLGEPLRS